MPYNQRLRCLCHSSRMQQWCRFYRTLLMRQALLLTRPENVPGSRMSSHRKGGRMNPAPRPYWHHHGQHDRVNHRCDRLDEPLQGRSRAGQAVRLAEERSAAAGHTVALADLDLADYQTLWPGFERDLYDVLNYEGSVEAHTARGGTARAAVEQQLALAREALAQADR